MSDVPLLTRLWVGRDAIAADIVAALVSEIGAYSALDDAQVTKLREHVDHIVATGLTLIAESRPYAEEDLAAFADQGERRAVAGFPMGDFMRAHEVAALAAQRQFWRVATERDWAEVLPAAAWLADEVPRAIEAATFGYVTARSQAGSGGLARLMVARHLLSGKPAEAVAVAAGLKLVPDYLVLACRLGSGGNGNGGAQGSRAELASALTAAVPGVLWRMTPRELAVLLPVNEGIDSAHVAAKALVGQIAKVLDCLTPAAMGFRPGLAGIPGAAADARALLRLLAALPDAQTRLYQAGDLLLEDAIAHNPTLASTLAGLLGPLSGGVGLYDTLVALLAADGDREQTAASLHIHRRTLAYRLDRIKALTGIDPRRLHGITLLRTAVTATRLAAPQR